MTRTLRRTTVVTAALVAGLALTACGSSDDGGQTADDSSYPLTLESPYGETTLDEQPEKVAVISDVDLDIALALGVEPVKAPLYGEISTWTADSAADQGFGELSTYDASDGVDFEALAEAAPDVILATSGYTLEDDFEQLSKIAPVVSYDGANGLTSMTWEQRTDTAARALGLTDEAAALKDEIATQFADVRGANPDFEGTTYTQVNIHPEQITYESYEGSDTSFFSDLGFVPSDTAAKYSATNNGVSKENIDQLDADVLFVGYPFGDEGLLTRDELESDRLFTSLGAVEEGHYAVIPDEVASPLTYKTPLSVPWVLTQMTPLLQQAVAGS